MKKNSIIITVHLNGAISGSVHSVDKQKHTIHLSGGKNYSGGPHTRTILHTDRTLQEAIRTFTISEHIVEGWLGEGCPSWVHLNCSHWERDKKWKKLSFKIRLKLYLESFNEGFGVSYKFIEDGEN